MFWLLIVVAIFILFVIPIVFYNLGKKHRKQYRYLNSRKIKTIDEVEKNLDKFANKRYGI